MTIEEHPLQPFLPHNGRILFLGSFPPPKEKWSMDFFYPNWINDFWRLMGLIFYKNAHHFEIQGEKRFDKDRIMSFANEHGLAFFDTARKVCRMKDNASDQFLEILEPTIVSELLHQMPKCKFIVTTGGKASEELMKQLHIEQQPAIGHFLICTLSKREIQWWRMPSSSRAYPLNIHKKAEFYQLLFK